jgi:hypothetical protein
MKMPTRTFKVLNFQFIIFNRIILTYFCLQPSELNHVFNFVKRKSYLICVEFEVLTAVVMNSTILRDITSCSPLKVNRRFGGTSPPSVLATCFHFGFLLGLLLEPEDGGNVPSKRRLTFDGLPGVISQKILLFI